MSLRNPLRIAISPEVFGAATVNRCLPISVGGTLTSRPLLIRCGLYIRRSHRQMVRKYWRTSEGVHSGPSMKILIFALLCCWLVAVPEPNQSNQSSGKDNGRAVRIVSLPPRSAGDTIALVCTIILTLVGVGGIAVAICTLRTIAAQTKATVIAARATQASARATQEAAEATRNSVDLQKTLKTQWVELDKWAAKAPWDLKDKSLTIKFFFDIVNPTDMPLTLRFVDIFTGGRKQSSNVVFDLVPKGRRPTDFNIEIRNKEQIDLYFADRLVLNIFGQITFQNGFKERQKQLFGEVCVGGVHGFHFQQFDGWIPSEDEEPEDNYES